MYKEALLVIRLLCKKATDQSFLSSVLLLFIITEAGDFIFASVVDWLNFTFALVEVLLR